MGEDELGHRSCSGHITVELFVQVLQVTEDSTERPVVIALLMVEFRNFEAATKMASADHCTEDTRVNTKVFAVREKLHVKDIKISFWDLMVV